MLLPRCLISRGARRYARLSRRDRYRWRENMTDQMIEITTMPLFTLFARCAYAAICCGTPARAIAALLQMMARHAPRQRAHAPANVAAQARFLLYDAPRFFFEPCRRAFLRLPLLPLSAIRRCYAPAPFCLRVFFISRSFAALFVRLRLVVFMLYRHAAPPLHTRLLPPFAFICLPRCLIYDADRLTVILLPVCHAADAQLITSDMPLVCQVRRTCFSLTELPPAHAHYAATAICLQNVMPTLSLRRHRHLSLHTRL